MDCGELLSVFGGKVESHHKYLKNHAMVKKNQKTGIARTAQISKVAWN
jgi:hypothetical protein